MIRGSLFTRFFLEDGVRDTDAYTDLAAAEVARFAAGVRAAWAELASMGRPREAGCGCSCCCSGLRR